MAYCRWGEDSDLYVFMHVNGVLECCGCFLDKENRMSFTAHSTQEMVDHLAEHRTAGHKVRDIEARLWEEDEENFPTSCCEGHLWGPIYQPYADRGDDGFLNNIERRDCVDCGWTTDWIPMFGGAMNRTRGFADEVD